MEVTGRLLQESCGLVPWVGLAESSLVTEWALGEWKWVQSCGRGWQRVGLFLLGQWELCCQQIPGVSVLTWGFETLSAFCCLLKRMVG